MLMPVHGLIALCRRHGVLVLVDGAHTPGQIDLDLENLGADFFAGRDCVQTTTLQCIQILATL